MEGFFRRYRNVLVLIAVVMAQVIALASQVSRSSHGMRNGDHSHAPRMMLFNIFAPLEKLFTLSGHGIRGLWNGYINLRHTHDINVQLQKQLDQLRLHEAAMAEDARQGQRLRALLEFRQQYIAHTVAAQVIGNSGSDNSNILTLDKGSSDGLKPDMAVITPDGIVGKIRNVSSHTAELLLINDSTSGVGVVLENTRIRAVLRGTPNGITEITNLLPDSRIKPGDHIVTTGGDMVYPRGLNVGVVKAAGPDPDHQPYARIIVTPSANLARLEEVLVITDTAAVLPDTSGEDSQTKSTSEVLGERLPGLHDPNETKDAEAAAADPNSPQNTAIPHPKPAIHSDKYTPGSAPPASELQPGARSGNPSSSQEKP